MGQKETMRRTHFDENRTCTFDCGCIIRIPLLRAIPPTLAFCPLHAAAPKLLEASKRAKRAIYRQPDQVFRSLDHALLALDAAIAEAEAK